MPTTRFHMDVLPVIPDPDGDDTAILLSDRDLFQWQHSNPIGYADWFWRSMGDAVEIARAQLAATLSRDVEDVPRWLVRTTLQRVVQLLKLHRNTFFHNHPQDKPASILITTLATHAYGGERDLYEAYRNIARTLPSYIERRNREFWVPNPAHAEENFADKWNTDPARKAHFDRWAQTLITDADQWIGSAGIDEAVRSLGAALGSAPVQAGAKRVATRLSSATATGALAVTPRGRLTNGRGTEIPPTRLPWPVDHLPELFREGASYFVSHYPDGTTKLKAGTLQWTGELQPSEISNLYLVGSTVRAAEALLTSSYGSPGLVADADGHLPHTYQDGSLCLYKPDQWDTW